MIPSTSPSRASQALRIAAEATWRSCCGNVSGMNGCPLMSVLVASLPSTCSFQASARPACGRLKLRDHAVEQPGRSLRGDHRVTTAVRASHDVGMDGLEAVEIGDDLLRD